MTPNSLDLWRLSDELSIIDAVILVTGNNPAEGWWNTNPLPHIWVKNTNYDGFEPVFKAVRGAVLSNQLRVSLVTRARKEREMFEEHHYESEHRQAKVDGTERKIPYDFLVKLQFKGGKVFTNGTISSFESADSIYILDEPDWNETTVAVDDLRKWLASKHIFPEFFFPNTPIDGFRNRDHPRYSAKLACAVAAWEEVEKPKPKKSVKGTVEAWVLANADRFEMVGSDGTPTEQAVKQVASVVNWDTAGGAVPTSTTVTDNDNEQPEVVQNFEDIVFDPDDPPF